MIVLNPKVDLFLLDGCGRCKYYATPKCKVHQWNQELQTLRQIALESGLSEELKWGMPVYTHKGKNIFMLSAFKEFCSINFFKGVLLKDTANILEKQGESSQTARIVKFTEIKKVQKLATTLSKYIREAVQLEESGVKVEVKQEKEPPPQELLDVFLEDTQYKAAFYALTPGKQRAYILYFSQAKQSATRLSRISAKRKNILNGEGMNDKYKS